MSETLFDTPQRRKRQLVFLMDENVCGPSIVSLLREIRGWRIESHRDHLPRGASDFDVVGACGKNRWTLITTDEMRYTPETKLAMVAWDVCSFKVITRKETHFLQIVSALVASRERMFDLLSTHKPGPFCAHVQLGGVVNIMTTFDEFTLTESQRKTIRKYGALKEPPLWAKGGRRA
jgi:hypothetical protein